MELVDPIQVTTAMAVAAIVAAAIFMLLALFQLRTSMQESTLSRWGATSVLALAAGYYSGCWWLGLLPEWSVDVDRERMLLVVVPAAIAVESLGALLQPPATVLWLLRGGIAVSLTRVLLAGSVYVSNASGPDSAEWSVQYLWLVCLMVGALLLAIWASLFNVARQSSRFAVLVLAITAVAISLTVMLSGYATGGQLGLPLAAALACMLSASALVCKACDFRPAIGIACVTLASLIVVGLYFAQLSLLHALVLATSPLLCFVSSLPKLRNASVTTRRIVALTAVLVPLILVVADSRRRFVERWGPPVTPLSDPTIPPFRSARKLGPLICTNAASPMFVVPTRLNYLGKRLL